MRAWLRAWWAPSSALRRTPPGVGRGQTQALKLANFELFALPAGTMLTSRTTCQPRLLSAL